MNKGERFFRDEPEKYFAVALGWKLLAINIKLVPDGWLMMVKVEMPRRKPQVAFIHSSESYGCWDYLYMHLTKTNVPLKWREDKWKV